MKKINYLLPLLMVPFVFSCANNQGGGGDDPEPEIVTEVDEAEFNKAVSLEGVEFLQVEQTSGPLEIKYEFSPTVYYWSHYTTSQFGNETDGEVMVRKTDGGYQRVTRSTKDGEWGNVEETIAKDFKYPTDAGLHIAPSLLLTDVGLSYSSFSFSDNKYHCEKEVQGKNTTFSIYFANKKCVEFGYSVDSVGTFDYKYAYENKTPVWPK